VVIGKRLGRLRRVRKLKGKGWVIASRASAGSAKEREEVLRTGHCCCSSDVSCISCMYIMYVPCMHCPKLFSCWDQQAVSCQHARPLLGLQRHPPPCSMCSPSYLAGGLAAAGPARPRWLCTPAWTPAAAAPSMQRVSQSPKTCPGLPGRVLTCSRRAPASRNGSPRHFLICWLLHGCLWTARELDPALITLHEVVTGTPGRCKCRDCDSALLHAACAAGMLSFALLSLVHHFTRGSDLASSRLRQR
jgi:hypothetical protein